MQGAGMGCIERSQGDGCSAGEGCATMGEERRSQKCGGEGVGEGEAVGKGEGFEGEVGNVGQVEEQLRQAEQEEQERGDRGQGRRHH